MHGIKKVGVQDRTQSLFTSTDYVGTRSSSQTLKCGSECLRFVAHSMPFRASISTWS